MSAQQALDAEGGLDLGLPVRAINRSDVTVTWQYDRRKYVIPPGEERLIPYMAMVLYQGDPRAIDKPGGRPHEQPRRQGLEHLRVLHGVYEHEERWADIPLVECYPIDSDIRFETILHDPEGNSVSGVSAAQSESAFLRNEVERMAQQLRVLESRAALAGQQEAAIASSGMTAADLADLDRQETSTRVASPEEATGQSMVGPSPERRIAPKGGRTAREGADVPVTRDGE